MIAIKMGSAATQESYLDFIGGHGGGSANPAWDRTSAEVHVTFRATASTALRTIAVLAALSLAVCAGADAQARPALMRFPTTSERQVAFTAEGALWTAPLSGGIAQRILSSFGDIIAPRFSPDGRWIAFTRSVGGSLDLYVVAASGGAPRRLTFDGAGRDDTNLGVAWTPDSKRIVFLSSHGASNSHEYRAFLVPLEGGLPEQMPLDHAGLLSFSPDGGEIVLNRLFRNYELRKRYVGGLHQNLSLYDLRTETLTPLTRWKGTDTSPMWIGQKIFFLSDRGSDFRKNIWVIDLPTRAIRQVTKFSDYDVDWPSLGGAGITFQQGGKVYRLDPASEKVAEIRLELPSGRGDSLPREVDASRFIRTKDALGGVDYSLSPDGRALLVSAHGDLVRLTAGGEPVNLTATPGIDEDHPSWSPDGRTIAYTTDVDGEWQVAVRPATGGRERLLTHSRAGYFYSAVWSPQGDMLAVADANHALWLAPVQGGAPALVARDPYAEIRDASFSPDGRWLAYSTQRATRLRAIHLREIASGRDVVVSSPMESDRLPVFTADGRDLAFVSQRHEQPFVSDRDDESLIATINSDGLYAAPLRRDNGAPGQGQAATAPSGPLRIDVDGLMARAVALPVTPAVITSLQARGGELFYEAEPPQLISGDVAGQTGAVHAFDLAAGHDRQVASGPSSYALSADGSALAYPQGSAWRLAGTRPRPGAAANPDVALNLAGMRAPVDARRDWAEMLQNAWRLDRDVFFSPVMNGTDWRAVHDAYARLWPLIGSEQDFLYLLGEMQGEIASSHIFVDASASLEPQTPQRTPLLGVDFTLDGSSGRYRLARIYKGDQSRPSLRGPLGAPGLGVSEGDYLLAVDGRELRAPAAPLSAFAGLSGPLTLSMAASPSGPRRTVTVDPVESDLPIRRLAWEQANRRTVERLSGGRLGYVSLSNFDADGETEFFRQFYPQLDKQGLIFDVRWNRGGFTSQAILEVLRRVREGVFVNREGALSPLPTAAPPPAMTVIENEASSSDGDQFPYYFRRYGLGEIVGERTWGGVQGINGPWTLMDGTAIYIPKDSLADRGGRWLIENAGVEPDLAIDTFPADPTGVDPQLAAAIRLTLERMKARSDPPARAPGWLPAYPAAGRVPGASEPPETREVKAQGPSAPSPAEGR